MLLLQNELIFGGSAQGSFTCGHEIIMLEPRPPREQPNTVALAKIEKLPYLKWPSEPIKNSKAAISFSRNLCLASLTAWLA